MMADLVGYAGLVFGYFFFWTIHDDFPPGPEAGPGLLWPVLGLVLGAGAWGATLLARRLNRRAAAAGPILSLAVGIVLALASAAAMLAGPWLADMDPASHVYPATIWVLAIWTAVHLGVGVLMQAYCIASRAAGRMSPDHDIDICNVALYWHFAGITVLATFCVFSLFPLVS
jgi:cytochrome c oxidase subunit I+III